MFTVDRKVSSCNEIVCQTLSFLILCQYMNGWMVSDDMNPILRQVLNRVIAKDLQLEKSYTRRLLVTAMNDCLSLKSVNDDVV